MRDRMLTPCRVRLDAVFSSQDIDYCVDAFEIAVAHNACDLLLVHDC